MPDGIAPLYPITPGTCLLSCGVTAFRGPEHDGYPFLALPIPVTLLTAAAPRSPPLLWEHGVPQYAEYGTTVAMEQTIAAIIKAAEDSGCSAVILSAFGCGAFKNPPELVASMFREQLFASSLTVVDFCIVEDHNSGHAHNPGGNFQAFANVFARPLNGPGVQLPSRGAHRHHPRRGSARPGPYSG